MWNPDQQIASMQPAVAKLVGQLAKDGIDFFPITPDWVQKSQKVATNNVGFVLESNPRKMAIISHHSFYRFSGILCITRDKKGENNQSETIPVTDDQYMQVFMKPIIYTLLEKS